MTRLDNGRVLYATEVQYRRKAMRRREANRAEQRCINDTLGRTHDKPRDGHTKCEACLAVQRGGPRRRTA